MAEDIGHELEHALTAQPRVLADMARLKAEKEILDDQHAELTQQILAIHRQIDALKARCQHTDANGKDLRRMYGSGTYDKRCAVCWKSFPKEGS